MELQKLHIKARLAFGDAGEPAADKESARHFLLKTATKADLLALIEDMIVTSGSGATHAASSTAEGGVKTPAAASAASASPAEEGDKSAVPSTSGNASSATSEFTTVERKKNPKRPPVCKSLYRGVKCSDDNCDRTHLPLCDNPACRAKRLPDCPAWHTVPRSGKDTRGKRQSSSNPKAVKTARTVKTEMSELRYKLEKADNLRLRAQLALSKARQAPPPPPITGRTFATVASTKTVPTASPVAPVATPTPAPKLELAQVLGRMADQLATLVATLQN
jgi:hypothetical protein